jgi:hypothetical protein
LKNREPSALCYRCHVYELYRNGAGDTLGAGSRFFNGSVVVTVSGSPLSGPMHAYHSGSSGALSTGLELGCLACHVSHGSTTLEHLIRGDVGYTHTAPNEGSCDNACHAGAHSYTGS